MSEINLVNLKLQVESLIASRTQLIAENRSLRTRMAKIIQERALLLNKKDKVSQKLKALISQLKEETTYVNNE